MVQAIRRALYIIDPQKCFMDLLFGKPSGMPLPVPGADADMNRLAAYIRHDPFYYKTIIVTLDTHPHDHISHANRWVDIDGNAPAPFTLIFAADYQAGVWLAANPADQQWQGEYLTLLEAQGRVHTIWPVHGQKGEREHEVHDGLKAALDFWEQETGGKVKYVEKGMHRDTEQFGVFAASVPIEGAPETYLNIDLVTLGNMHDAVDVSAEAASHCTKDSTEQYLEAISEADWSKVTVLRDTMSPVAAVLDVEGNIIPEADFPKQAAQWLEGLPGRGVAVDTVARRMAA